MSNVITALMIAVPLVGGTPAGGGGFAVSSSETRNALSSERSGTYDSQQTRGVGQSAVRSSAPWASVAPGTLAAPRGERPGLVARVVSQVSDLVGLNPPGGGSGNPGGPACRWRSGS